jgi:hypothetical protein
MIDSKSGRHLILLASAASAALVLTACGSSAPSGSRTPTHTTSGSAAAGTSGSAAAGSTGSAAGGSAPATAPAAGGSSADAATVAAITKAYRTFFAPGTPLPTSIGLLQNGAAFASTLEQQGNSSFAQKASASVSDISLVSADTARLRYTISVGGQPMLKDQTGYAVRENGTWKLADYTFCQLMTLQGSAPAACKTPTATTAPK